LRAIQRGPRESRRLPRERSAPATLGQARVTLPSHDDVIEDGDADELAHLAQARRELEVLPRRRRIARYAELRIAGAMWTGRLGGRRTGGSFRAA
jgi:hypothetical protein